MLKSNTRSSHKDYPASGGAPPSGGGKPASVTAVIVTHNNTETIQQCLKSLAEHDISRLVIIDNASTDNTLKASGNYIERYKLKAKSYKLLKNVGFATAANHGAARATTDYLFFCNPDAILSHDPAPALAYLDTTPTCAAVGLGLINEEGQLEPWSFGRQPVTPFTLLKRKLSALPRHRQLPTHFHVAWSSGGALLVRRSAFVAVGGFDPHFFLYWEDVDLCHRLEESDFTIELFPHLTLRHARGVSLPDNRAKARLYDESADRYFQKHYPAYIWWPLQHIRHFYRWLQPFSR